MTAAGAERSELSIVITTSAWLRDGRLPEPAKITASMSAARSDLCEVSPIAQRSASTRFDLPQPFGPTTPVRAGFDHEISGFNERLEALEAQAGEFHGHDSLLAGRESPCRDNTIEGNVGVVGESPKGGSHGRDNGEGAAAGQPAQAAFPKAFAGLTGGRQYLRREELATISSSAAI